MYRFLLTPRWLVAHVVVAAIAVLFVSLGLWQLRRLDEVRARNARVEQRLSAPVAPLDEVVGTGPVDYRRVSVAGTFLPDQEVLLSPRSRNGVPGHEVVTPLDLGDGRALLVDRGWVPLEMNDPPVARAAPPSGRQTVQGWLRTPGTARQYGPLDGPRIEFLSVVDVELLADQVGAELVAAYLVADPAVPAGELPRSPLPIELDDGPHAAYAVQWFLFALVGVVGYPLLIRRSARDGDGAVPGTAAESQADPGRDAARVDAGDQRSAQ